MNTIKKPEELTVIARQLLGYSILTSAYYKILDADGLIKILNLRILIVNEMTSETFWLSQAIYANDPYVGYRENIKGITPNEN